jgi:hypothetical protein
MFGMAAALGGTHLDRYSDLLPGSENRVNMDLDELAAGAVARGSAPGVG